MRIPAPGDVREPLALAGAPHRLRDLDLGLEDARRALRIARDIRDRVTVLDLAFELGIFPDSIDLVLEESGV
jgi:hypothetical protein